MNVRISYPFLAVTGQRVILNLRRFRARQDTTRDLSREVDRQIAAMDDELSDRQSEHWLGGGPGGEEVSSGTIRMVNFLPDHESGQRNAG